MLLFPAVASVLLLVGNSATAFNYTPSDFEKGRMPSAANKNLANLLAAGVISAATLLCLPGTAVASNSLVTGTPLESKLVQFGAASYPVFNSITDVSPLADKFLEFLDKNIKTPDAAEVARSAVDGLLAIPDSAITEYSDVLKQVVYSDVLIPSCVTLGGSGSAAQKFATSAVVRSVPPSKIEALTKKFQLANSAVPVKDGDICLPGSVAASQKLWVAQAELTLSMPKAEASTLVSSVKKVGLQAPRTKLLSLVPAAEQVFSKNPEALKMLLAGKEVEPKVILTVQAALK